MVEKTWRKKLLEIAENKMDKFEIIHNTEHSLRVYENCKRIAKYYPKANLDVLFAASLLHDFGHTISKVNRHAHHSASLGEKILKQIKFPEKNTSLVLKAVADHDNHAWVKGHSPNKPRLLESKILQDADRLETFGAIGIGRNFAWGGKHHKPLWDKTKKLCPEKLYGNNYSVIHTLDFETYNYKYLNTPVAKKLGQKRLIFLKQFIKEFINEWNYKY